MTTHLLFLDRDGTLNRTLGGRPPNTIQEIELLPNTQILARFVQEGWQLVVISNQGGVAQGYLTEEQARAVQAAVIQQLQVPVGGSHLCPHMPHAQVAQYAVDCPNRKPNPGFIETSLWEYDAQPGDCLFVGDTITDQQAAHSARVPFQWADRFFQRPIDRGLLAADDRWIQIRQAQPADLESLALSSLAEADPVHQPVWDEARKRIVNSASGDLAGMPDLYLVARREGNVAGWLIMLRGRTFGDRASANLALTVLEAYQGLGIDALLMETGLDWASTQRNLRRLCIYVPTAQAPVARLCCRLGFTQNDADAATETGSLLTMSCDR